MCRVRSIVSLVLLSLWLGAANVALAQTPIPTDTPAPPIQTYADVALPHGTARVLYTMTFGDVAVVVVWLGILLVMATSFVWERIEKWIIAYTK